MKIVIPGGSGQVGTMLARHRVSLGDEVVVLSRRPTVDHRWRSVRWDGRTLGAWVDEFEGADVVVNLAGRSVDCRYHDRNRREIMDSRIDSTRAVGRAIAAVGSPPSVWLQASTATIYADRYDAPNDEATGRIGGDEPNVPETWRFSIEVARAWEAAALECETPATRLVLLRSALTLSPDAGGVFDVLLRLVRWGLGGRHGHGRQFVSWIHEADFLRAVDWLMTHDVDGPVNLSSPTPVPNAEFMATLRRAWGARLGLPAPRWLLEVGTFLMRTESELVLKSRRVVPGRLREEGFEFEFPEWTAAADDLCKRYRDAGSSCPARRSPSSQWLERIGLPANHAN